MYHNKSAKFWKCSYDYAIFANEFPAVSHLFFIFAVFPNLSPPFSIQHDNWTNNGVDGLWLWLCTQCIQSNSVLQPIINYHIPIGRAHTALCACPLFRHYFSLCKFIGIKLMKFTLFFYSLKMLVSGKILDSLSSECETEFTAREEKMQSEYSSVSHMHLDSSVWFKQIQWWPLDGHRCTFVSP